jgi:GxxExxY protein
MHENEIGTIVVGECIDIHKESGPGLWEIVYEVVLVDALRRRGLQVERQIPIPITFRGREFDEGFKADVIVERKVLLELKSVEKIIPAHKKQVNTYLRLTGCKLGYLLNFGEALMKDGIYRIVNGLEE